MGIFIRGGEWKHEMNGSELIRKRKKLSKERDIRFDYDASRGSHGMIFLGNRCSTMVKLNAEVNTKTLRTILGNLGLSMKDLEGK